jgi:hypothetical protein
MSAYEEQMEGNASSIMGQPGVLRAIEETLARRNTRRMSFGHR